MDPHNLAFHQLTKNDLDLIEKWLRQLHVARWFPPGDGWLEEIRDNLDSDWIWYYRVDFNNQPFGFIQCYNTKKAPPGEWSSQPEGTFGIDFFIGLPELIGCGLGKRMIAEFIEVIKSRLHPLRIIADPVEGNAHSERLLLSCGFEADTKNGLYIFEC